MPQEKISFQVCKMIVKVFHGINDAYCLWYETNSGFSRWIRLCNLQLYPSCCFFVFYLSWLYWLSWPPLLYNMQKHEAGCLIKPPHSCPSATLSLLWNKCGLAIIYHLPQQERKKERKWWMDAQYPFISVHESEICIDDAVIQNSYS